MCSFRYIRYHDIDKRRWDECIASASNGLVYAYSWFLDHMSPNWDALIYDDYSFVMPLTWRNKFGILYLYQPAFAAQLGVFGNGITDELVLNAIASIPKKYKLVEISLNEQNHLVGMSATTSCRNYLLDLNSPPETLKQRFSISTSRNILKSIKSGNTFVVDVPVKEILDLMLLKMSSVSNVNEDDVQRFSQLFHYASQRGLARAFGVYSRSGRLLSSAVIFHSNNRAYYLMVGNDPDGRISGASHALINGIIEYYSGRPILFDFEGSDIEGVARFYESFGAYPVQYLKLRLKRFPLNLRFWRR